MSVELTLLSRDASFCQQAFYPDCNTLSTKHTSIAATRGLENRRSSDTQWSLLYALPANHRHFSKMAGRPSDVVPSRVAIDTEAAWFTIKSNLEKNMQTLLDARLATLSGDKNGLAAVALRNEVEQRLAQVCRLVWPRTDTTLDGLELLLIKTGMI